ncbi:hypothetical protein [Polaromonas sp. YR568]|uniref:hypothetical protein n=1 Tax=Polaromonas sp. YR568 TaxID=1855301 RepID=UPI00313848BB
MALAKSKTFWTGVAAIATAGTGYATGEFTSPEAVQIGLNGLLGIFLRMALLKSL